MISAVAREARSGRSKAREVSRKLARIHRGAREELSGAESTTLWILGGVAVLGGGYLAFQALNKPAAAATSTPGTTPSPSTPSPSPSAPSSTVTWPSGAFPWAPPSNPAALPPGFQLTDDLTSQDPMWIAMAQSALNIMTRVSSSPSLQSTVAVSYSTAPNGVVDTSFMIALTQIQSYLMNTITQLKAATPSASFLTNPHTNGILDLKTLAILILISASAAAAGGSTGIVGTTITDPILNQEATVALGNAVSAGSSSIYAVMAKGLTNPITLSPALSQFQANWNASNTSLQIPVTGNLDWISWSALESFAG